MADIGVLVNQGENLTLAAILNKTAPQDLDLCLYKNNYTIVEASLESDLTPADFTGYAVKQLTAASWTITNGDPTTASYAIQTFTSTAGSQNQNIYGWYLKQRTSGKLIAGGRFSTVDNIANNGDFITVTPTITLE